MLLREYSDWFGTERLSTSTETLGRANYHILVLEIVDETGTILCDGVRMGVKHVITPTRCWKT